MRAQLGAVGGGQHLFQQRAEDRGLDAAPILLRGDQQLALGTGDEIIDARAREQIAVEIADHRIALRPIAVHLLRVVHPAPQAFQPIAPELVGAALRVGEESLKAALVQQPGILGEHAEQRSHQEQAGLLDPQRDFRVAGAQLALVGLQLRGDPRQALGDVAGHLRRAQPGVDARRVGPDRAQRVGGGGVDAGQLGRAGEIGERDAVMPLVGKGRIAAPVARPVEIQLERPADVRDEQERRRAMPVGQRQRVPLRLQPRVRHQPVIAGHGRFRLREPHRGAEQVEDRLGRRRDRLGGRGLAGLEAGLLGLKDEAIALIEVDALAGLGPEHRLGADGRFEAIVLGRVSRVAGRRHAERLRELGQEQLVLRPLAGPGLADPFGEKLRDRHRRLVAGVMGGGKFFPLASRERDYFAW